MDSFSVFLGVAAGYGIAYLVWWLREPIAEADPSLAHSSAAAPATEDDEGRLTRRLHALNGAISAFTDSAAHPRECAMQAEFKEAVALLADETVPMRTVLAYALGANWTLSCVGLAALKVRGDRQQAADQVIEHTERFVPWALHFALEFVSSLDPRPPVGAPLRGIREWWIDVIILPGILTDYFDRATAYGDPARFPDSFAPAPHDAAAIVAVLERIPHKMAAELIGQLSAQRQAAVDHSFLASFGRFWPKRSDRGQLIEPECWKPVLAEARATVTRSPPRSLIATGEPLSGKTTFLRLLADGLADSGWQVFEASGPDLQAGQQWIGQLEERLRRIIEEASVGKKLIWYVPDLLHLARSGTHQGQSASMLDQVLPAVTSGRLVIWSEATPTQLARLVQTRPGLRRLFETVMLDPMTDTETLALADAVVRHQAQRMGLTAAPGTAKAALDAAQQYLAAQSFPGAPLVLLKLTTNRAQSEKQKSFGPPDVLETLSQLTGLPVSILDARAGFDLDSVRATFTASVIGQDEAVTTVVERIAMLKAGLNDPGRPIGVFLFAGPTGTGKTELAKTTASYLFGSADRMIRLDMSEFQTADSVGRLLGEGPAGTEAETLISTVRKQPFSVLLLDEFEKAHPRIWDLFLQVFDDARLTDQMGQVADFRHCLIIMTSNIGATSHRTSGLGFAPTADAFTSDQIQRAISQTWRPEFQNRIDKIIVFRPLTRELMRGILKKELDRVLARRGLKDRGWAVEWEASALEFLLEKGFSPEMGARPLKRAVDQFLLAPLARTIVERRYPEGEQFVFVRSDGKAIQAEFVDPDSDETWLGQAPANADDARGESVQASLPAMILSPEGTSAEAVSLGAALTAIEARLDSVDWETEKRGLTQRMGEAAFWASSDRHTTLARLAMMDRIGAATETAAALQTRLQRGGRRSGNGRDAGFSRELIGRLALQIHLCREGLRDFDERAAIEVALAVEPALEGGNTDMAALRDWCADLAEMYKAWASVRHMQMSELQSSSANAPPSLLVSGFGAARTLRREMGLHVLEGGEGGGLRCAARIKVVDAPLGDVPAAKLAGDITRMLASAPATTTVARRYRREPSPLVRNASGSWRTGRLEQVMRGDFDLLEVVATET